MFHSGKALFVTGEIWLRLFSKRSESERLRESDYELHNVVHAG